MKRNFFLLVFSLLVGFGIAEIYLSRFFPQKTYIRSFQNAINCFARSKFTVFELKPNCTIKFHDFDTGEEISAKINSVGLRGNEFEEKKKPDEKRILFEGDSFILGFGVKDDDLVTTHLQQKLKDASKLEPLGQANVINAGYAGGFGPDGYYIHLREKGMKLQPDLVVFNIFVFNDLSDIENSDWIGASPNGVPQRVESKKIYVDENGYLLPKDTPLIYHIPVLRESHVAILTANTLGQLAEGSQKIADKIKFRLSPAQFPTGDARDTNLPGVYGNLCFFAGICHRSSLHAFDDLFALIRESNKLANEQNHDARAHFVVVLIPVDFQLYPDALAKYKIDDGIPQSSLTDRDPDPQKRIKQMLDAEKIPYIDLLSAMRNSSDRLTFVTDGHWNSNGHAIAAQEIYKWIQNNYK